MVVWHHPKHIEHCSIFKSNFQRFGRLKGCYVDVKTYRLCATYCLGPRGLLRVRWGSYVNHQMHVGIYSWCDILLCCDLQLVIMLCKVPVFSGKKSKPWFYLELDYLHLDSLAKIAIPNNIYCWAVDLQRLQGLPKRSHAKSSPPMHCSLSLCACDRCPYMTNVALLEKCVKTKTKPRQISWNQQRMGLP